MTDNFDLFRNPPDPNPREDGDRAAPAPPPPEDERPVARRASRNLRAMIEDGFRIETYHDGVRQSPAPPASAAPVPVEAEDDDLTEEQDEPLAEEPELLDEAAEDEEAVPVVARRKSRSRRRPAGASPVWLAISTFSTLLTVIIAAVLVSTLFSLWTSPTFFSDEFRAGLNRVQATQRLINIQPTPLPTSVHEIKIGIVAGHSGKPQDPTQNLDPGAVCDDGLTELSINQGVAGRVLSALQRDGYSVELLTEFDPRLANYTGDVLVSIHSNDCRDYGPEATGYNVASAAARGTTRGEDERLLDCLVEQYGATTGLPRHFGITVDMTEYHTFGEVSTDTPTAIIELGFMRNDRAILTGQQDLVAQGVANGIRCFLRPEIYTTVSSATPDAITP